MSQNNNSANTFIGLEGVLMKANRWFTTKLARTDVNGEFRMSSGFNRPCNYSLEFSLGVYPLGGFAVTEHWWGNQASINGPKLAGDWTLDIFNGYDRFCSHIFRGAFRYHNKQIGGLMRPFRPSGNLSLIQAKDAAKNWQGINWTLFPVIRIARFNGINNTEWQSDEIFSTTCHELAHTSHVITMNAGIIQFGQVSNPIVESWPAAIEWYLTGLEYKSRGILNYGESTFNPTTPPGFPNQFGYQNWTKTMNNISADYTNLFINLVDNFNDGTGFSGSPNDQVTGYTLANIESGFLKHVYGLSNLSTILKANKPVGVTDAQIDLLLSSY